MVLTGVSLLSSTSQTVWIQTTETAIQDEVTSILNNQVELVNVQVTITSQNPQRRLQELFSASSASTVITSNLTIAFDVRFFIRAVIEDHNVRRYVGAALDTEGDKNVFILQLRSSGETAFQNLTSVQLILPPSSINEDALQTESDSESLGAGWTIGIIILSVAAVTLTIMAFMLFLRMSPKKGHSQTATSSSSPQAAKNLREFEGDGVTLNISDKEDFDVSTLGDPLPQGMKAVREEASMAEETMSLPYDYKVAAHTLPSLGDSASYSFSEVGSVIVDVQLDDDTLDAQYFIEDRIEVEAPPGLLGLVLEADSEGVATVCNMKDSGPLAGRVHIGDRLVSVDGLDVTATPVASVMQIIASKKTNKKRKLTFSRPSRKSMHRDDGKRKADEALGPWRGE